MTCITCVTVTGKTFKNSENNKRCVELITGGFVENCDKIDDTLNKCNKCETGFAIRQDGTKCVT